MSKSLRRNCRLGNDRRADKLQRGWIQTWLWLIGLVGLTFVSGCGSCNSNDQEKLSKEELEKRKREQRESLQLQGFISLPTDTQTSFVKIKPGHWHETRQIIKSNRENLQISLVGSVYRSNSRVTIPGTDFAPEFARQTRLPKGQTKAIDLQFFAPFSGAEDDPLSTTPKLNFRRDVLAAPLMTPILQAPRQDAARQLSPHTFQLMVLSPQAPAYAHIAALDMSNWKRDDSLLISAEQGVRSYDVSLVKPVEQRYAIPKSMITMTSIAVVVWDDVELDHVSIDQQNAILDWIHWGGQLVISGPGSWSRLQNSFLTPYLPVESVEAAELGTDGFGEISKTWMTSDLAEPGRKFPLIIEGAAVAGLKLKLSPRGKFIEGSGQLIAEGQLGRGRIIVTGFPMRDPRIYNWRYYSNLFSTGILRRPPREIKRMKEGGVKSFVHRWAPPYQDDSRDPRLHSNFRILTRDLPLGDEYMRDETEDVEDGDEENVKAQVVAEKPSQEQMAWGSGGAAWSDYSGAGAAATEALKAAAGIELPSRKTIIWLLAGYLAFLVPLNWIVFKLLGKLEFAWIAAPIMALIGVVVVTRTTQLDIGFARRNTEISLLELYEGHPRGHLTRYLAMYTSLSTNYQVEFPEDGSVALPLAIAGSSNGRAKAAQRNLRTNYGRSKGVTLEPVTVYSNSTEMLHAEQMVELPGSMLLGEREQADSQPLPIVKNETGLNLRSALVIRCTAPGLVERAWIGDMDSGASVPLTFSSYQMKDRIAEWEANSATASVLDETQLEGGLWIGKVMFDLLRKTPLSVGQQRLIAFSDERPGELTVVPKEDQFDGRCIVIAHLSAASLPDRVIPDRNFLSRIPKGGLE